MKKCITLILSILLAVNLYGQENNRPALWVGPCDNVSVHGINIAPVMFKIPVGSTVNGLNIEGVGVPIFLFTIPADPINQIDRIKENTIRNDFNVNGLSVSPAGLIHPGTVNGLAVTPLYTFIDQVNGAQFSLIFNISYRLNGVCFSIHNSTFELNGVQFGLFNNAKVVNGVQFGLVNKTKKLSGVQIGLWNVNERWKRPFINW